ncbi:ABC-F family ATP-binding cassette domain-containing protein [Gudongella sp. SC589]|uniref:ABC-F family ATP-binding cassette domain-containing protein n=1 Tax=Gudongella sp. SC589 TaxID=3385990 RepID=UPI003904A644
MLKINEMSYSFPQKDLYKKISFELSYGQHCAFIGSSGIGKSTLIDMIMDPEEYMYDGTIEIEPGCRIGYVSQFPRLDGAEDTRVFEYIGREFISLQNEIQAICLRMETASEVDSLLEEYQNTLDTYHAIGGDDFESMIDRKLNLAGLMDLKDKLISELSGGEFKLVQVIMEMLVKPDILIMDEPDVFLDYRNLNSLKDLINSHKGILLVVTHNRYLLSHCFNKILHLENMDIQEFNGRYIDYNLEMLQAKIEMQELAIMDDEEIERNDLLIEKLRFLANQNAEASKGRSVNAKVKIQERLKARRVKAPFLAIRQPDMNFNSDTPLEDIVPLRVKDYSVAFDDVLLENVSFEIGSTDKVALIGANGTGKTTLLKDIYENSKESIEIGDGIKVSYLSQLQGEMLDGSNSIADELFHAGLKSYDEIRMLVSRYGFDEEAIDQKIDALSGGEKNMLQLAKASVSDANLLLLDEPTSHLDTYSQVALEYAIEDYKGSILMISHDYHTIVNCMDYVLIIEDRAIRRMSIRKFRKMIYDKHFDKDYLEIEQKKKSIERQIELALKEKNFEDAKVMSEQLEVLIKSM